MENSTQPAALRLLEIVDDLQLHLAHLKEEGARTIEVDARQLQVLKGAVAVAPARVERVDESQEEDMGKNTLESIAKRISGCQKCPLSKTRTKTVPGQGTPRPELMFVGEGPGADEDAQGLAFVGRAGQLLTKMINAMGFERDEVWIGNIVKCRPPNNRPPEPEEMEACLPYLRAQIALLQPKVIVCLGATAVKGLLNTQIGISKVRGQWMSFEGIDTMPTYHPAYLLRNPPAKRFVWEDLQEVLRHLGRPVPK